MLLCRRCPICRDRQAGRCPSCWPALHHSVAAPAPHGVDRLVAVYDYDEAARALLLAAKNRSRRDILDSLANSLAPPLGIAIDSMGLCAPGRQSPVVTWIPANPRARRRRGYDQGRLLAIAVARALGLPSRPLLRRRSGPAQTGRRLDARRRGPVLEPRVRRGPPVVVMVDDVCTSGSSLTVGAARLRSIGARTVVGGVVARVS